VTSNTSSRSVRATRKTAVKRDSNGTPPTDLPSEPISPTSTADETGWFLQFSNGGVQHVRVKGGRGRISFSAARGMGSGEVRIYRNESTKVYDAVFTGVVHVTSDRTEVIPSRWGEGDRSIEPRMGGAPPEPMKTSIVNVGTFKTSGKWSLSPTPSIFSAALADEDDEEVAVNPDDILNGK